MTALPIKIAAVELGISPAKLYRAINDGLPVVHRGQRGRGHGTMIDTQLARAWLDRDAREGKDAALRAIAARLPEVLAKVAEESFHAAPDKRGAGWTALASWQGSIYAVMDMLREHVPDLSDSDFIPERIERLRKISTK